MHKAVPDRGVERRREKKGQQQESDRKLPKEYFKKAVKHRYHYTNGSECPSPHPFLSNQVDPLIFVYSLDHRPDMIFTAIVSFTVGVGVFET